ncbi:hypothetical protein [Acidimicrobium ferrooxidans]|uniref:hypothetical protein n=1 Tax=Acidimicrobium ferrooxidans TaxID=53635 RepID=UPI00117D73F7|nr:hypothetical protein [Acidimicrobium ferrooxidans]
MTGGRVGVVSRDDILDGRVVLTASGGLDDVEEGVTVLALFGATEAVGGGPPVEVLGGFADRLAELSRRPVVTFAPRGLDGGGAFREREALADARRVLAEVGGPVVVLAATVAAGVGVALGRDERVVGVALVDPWTIGEAVAFGVNLDTDASIDQSGDALACAVLVVTDHERDVGAIETIAPEAEMHRLSGAARSFVLDARVLAIVAGWIERAPWSGEVASPEA